MRLIDDNRRRLTISSFESVGMMPQSLILLDLQGEIGTGGISIPAHLNLPIIAIQRY